jgi:hypothetical protein
LPLAGTQPEPVNNFGNLHRSQDGKTPYQQFAGQATRISIYRQQELLSGKV